MLDFHVSSEVQSSFRRVDAILSSGVFSPEGASGPLYFSALTELLIHLHDLLGKAAAQGAAIAFDDDVTKRGDVTDVRSLVTFVRNAVCHVSSGNHYLEEVAARVSFNTCFGCGCLAEINGLRFEGEYADDVAFFFGHQRLYLRRHVIRAYTEAKAALVPLLWRANRGA